MLTPLDLVNHGVLGVSLMILLIAVGVLMRVLQWAKEILVLVISRIEENTAALVRLTERLHGSEEDA